MHSLIGCREPLEEIVADPPLRLKPAVPGKFRWLDPRTLAFVSDEPLPRSTRSEVEARAGRFIPTPGAHLVRASLGGFEREITISFE